MATTSFSLLSDRRHLLLLLLRRRPAPRSPTRQTLTLTRRALRVGAFAPGGRRKIGALARVRVEDLESQDLVGGEEEVEVVDYEGFTWRWPPWNGLPVRYSLIGTTSLAFVICNMDKPTSLELHFLQFELHATKDIGCGTKPQLQQVKLHYSWSYTTSANMDEPNSL